MGKIYDTLKEHFENTPKDVLDREFEEINSKWGNIGPDVDKYEKFVRNIKENNNMKNDFEG